MFDLENIFGVVVVFGALFFAYACFFFGVWFWHTHDLRFTVLLAESIMVDVCLVRLGFTGKKWSCISYLCLLIFFSLVVVEVENLTQANDFKFTPLMVYGFINLILLVIANIMTYNPEKINPRKKR